MRGPRSVARSIVHADMLVRVWLTGAMMSEAGCGVSIEVANATRERVRSTERRGAAAGAATRTGRVARAGDRSRTSGEGGQHVSWRDGIRVRRCPVLCTIEIFPNVHY